jgi:hypothetical protein
VRDTAKKTRSEQGLIDQLRQSFSRDPSFVLSCARSWVLPGDACISISLGLLGEIIAQKKGSEVIDSVVPLTPIGNFFQWNILVRPVLNVFKNAVCLWLELLPTDIYTHYFIYILGSFSRLPHSISYDDHS